MIDKFIIRYEELQKLKSHNNLRKDEEDELIELSTKILYIIMEEPEIVSLFKRMKKLEYLDHVVWGEYENALKILAGSRLHDRNIALSDVILEQECDRIERCIEYHYKISKDELHYLKFGVRFMLEHFKEIVFGDVYSGLYLDDIKQVDWIDEYVE